MSLNKTQKEFRKQIEKLKNVKPYKEIIDDHNDFYHNTAYEQEVLEKYYKREKRKRIIIYLCILSILIFAGYKNIDKIDFDKIKANIVKSKIEATKPGTTMSFNSNITYTDNDKKQYEIAMYHMNYTKQIEPINVITESIIENGNLNNYFDINLINDELIVIDDLLKNFINFIPSDINRNLHNLNIKILICYKNLYNIALLLNNDNNQEIVNQYKYNNEELRNYYIEFRKEILKIFDDINMTYNIDENNIIHFTYKELEY